MTFAFLLLTARDMFLPLPFLNIGFLAIASIWSPNGFPVARPFSHDRKLEKWIVKATHSEFEDDMGRKLRVRSSHMSVHNRTQTETLKVLREKYQRHAKNYSGLRCCKDTTCTPNTEQSHSTQVHRYVPKYRKNHRGRGQLKQSLDAYRKEAHKHVRPTAQRRTTTTTVFAQTDGLMHRASASSVASTPTT